MRHWLLLSSQTLAFLMVSALALNCAHGPSEDDVKQADSHYLVALALVHEADKAASTGDLQTQDTKYREALRELLEGEKTQAMHSEGHYLLGLVYFLGFMKYDAAEAQLHTAIALRKKERDDEYPEAENLLGNINVSRGRPQAAVAYFERARTNLLYATPYFAEMGLGDAYTKLGRHDEALNHYRRSIVAQPDLCGAYLKMAEVHVSRGDDPAAQDALAGFLERCDSERLREATGARMLAPAYYQLAQSKLRTGDVAGAQAAFVTCAERFKNETVARQCRTELATLQSGR